MPARCAPCAIKKCIYWSAEINTKKNNQQESRNGAPVHQSAMLVALLVALLVVQFVAKWVAQLAHFS